MKARHHKSIKLHLNYQFLHVQTNKNEKIAVNIVLDLIHKTG